MKFKSIAALYRDSKRWTSGEYARTKNNRIVEASNPKAVKFCLYGALEFVYGSEYSRQSDALRKVIKKLFPLRDGIVIFNDHPETSISDIRKVVKLAKV